MDYTSVWCLYILLYVSCHKELHLNLIVQSCNDNKVFNSVQILNINNENHNNLSSQDRDSNKPQFATELKHTIRKVVTREEISK